MQHYGQLDGGKSKISQTSLTSIKDQLNKISGKVKPRKCFDKESSSFLFQMQQLKEKQDNQDGKELI